MEPTKIDCKLVAQEDWLEYPTGASLINKLMLIVIGLVGAFMFGFEIWLERQSVARRAAISGTVQNLFRTLQLIAAIMVIVPVVLLVIDWATASRVSTVSLALPAALLLFGLAAALVIVLVILQQQLPAEVGFPSWIWIPVGGLAAVSGLLLLYRWRTRSNLLLQKNKIDWMNVSASEALVRQIGARQGKRCGLEITGDEAVAAFGYYVNQQQEKRTTKTNWWGKLTGAKEQVKLPQDKFPNIVKMAVELKSAETNLSRNWVVAGAATKQALQVARAQNQAPVTAARARAQFQAPALQVAPEGSEQFATAEETEPGTMPRPPVGYAQRIGGALRNGLAAFSDFGENPEA